MFWSIILIVYKLIKIPVGAPYKFNKINLEDLVSSSTAQIYKLSFTVMWNINFAARQVFTNKNTHRLPSVVFGSGKLIPIYTLATWDVTGNVPINDVH